MAKDSKFRGERVIFQLSCHRAETVKVRRTSEVEVRYVRDCGDPVVTTLAAAHWMIRGLPVRKVRSHPPRRHYAGLFWSATNYAYIAYESRLERDGLWMVDVAPEARRIAARLLRLNDLVPTVEPC